MHGLVCVDANQQVLRNSIIWCDSRAVQIGEEAFENIGQARSLEHLLNSPGNFTASKLRWVKENEPALFEQIDKIMLPGDFIAMKLTHAVTTSISALSEGIFWDFPRHAVSEDVMQQYGFSSDLIPEVQEVFADHGQLAQDVAASLGLRAGIPVSYKAGDQPNNALSLNVLEPGEVAATAGTSGVIYGVSDALTYDPLSRVNSFAHVNHTAQTKRIGVLLCINGTGILYRWVRQLTNNGYSYAQMNELAAGVAPGSEGLLMLPFGNGAERMLENKMVDAHIHNIDLNKHSPAHLFRAAQEGIAFAFRYGLDIMRSNGMNPSRIRAGKANMFLSEVFTDIFVNVTGVPVELHEADGSIGAARGAGIGAKIYQDAGEAFASSQETRVIEPVSDTPYEALYATWKTCLEKQLQAAG